MLLIKTIGLYSVLISLLKLLFCIILFFVFVWIILLVFNYLKKIWRKKILEKKVKR